MLVIPEVYLGKAEAEVVEVLKPDRAGGLRSCYVTYRTEVGANRPFLVDSDLLLFLCRKRLRYRRYAFFVKVFVSSEDETWPRVLKKLGGSTKRGFYDMGRYEDLGTRYPQLNGTKLPLWLTKVPNLTSVGGHHLDLRLDLLNLGELIAGDFNPHRGGYSGGIHFPKGKSDFFLERAQLVVGSALQLTLADMLEVENIARSSPWTRGMSRGSEVLGPAPDIRTLRGYHLKSLKGFCSDLMACVTRPDLLWMGLRESAEEMARTVNWKKRPNRHEKALREDVTFARGISLRVFKDSIARSGPAEVSKVLGGITCPEIPRRCGDHFKAWLGYSGSVGDYSRHGNHRAADASEVACREVAWTAFYREICQSDDSEEASQVLKECAFTVSQAVATHLEKCRDWPSLTRSAKLLVPVISALVEAGQNMDTAVDTTRSCLNHLGGSDLAKIRGVEVLRV